MSGTILIYGATGYTGKLIAKVAADEGARPILAGRDLEKVQAIAKTLGLGARAFEGRRAGLRGSPWEGPESAPKPSIHC